MYYNRHLYRIRQEIWLNAWPRSILFILSMVQFWSTWLIIGLETWHGVLDYRHSFAFIGLITSIFFTISWVATMSMGKIKQRFDQSLKMVCFSSFFSL